MELREQLSAANAELTRLSLELQAVRNELGGARDRINTLEGPLRQQEKDGSEWAVWCRAAADWFAKEEEYSWPEPEEAVLEMSFSVSRKAALMSLLPEERRTGVHWVDRSYWGKGAGIVLVDGRLRLSLDRYCFQCASRGVVEIADTYVCPTCKATDRKA
jgi:hypothetical protein